MEDVRINLRKQKQLLAIELQQFKSAKEQGKPNIHSDKYYILLANAYKSLDRAIKCLEPLEDIVYNNFKYLEQ